MIEHDTIFVKPLTWLVGILTAALGSLLGLVYRKHEKQLDDLEETAHRDRSSFYKHTVLAGHPITIERVQQTDSKVAELSTKLDNVQGEITAVRLSQAEHKTILDRIEKKL